jgi:hypothetical protein
MRLQTTNTAMENNKIEFTRQELYELVWSRSTHELARQYKIGEHSLKMICVDMNIPLPGFTHIYYSVNGRRMERAPLPAKEGKMAMVVLHPDSADIKATYVPIRERKEIEEELMEMFGRLLTVPARLIDPDVLIVNTQAYISDNIHSADRCNKNLQVLTMNVNKDKMSRAYRFLDTLIKALRERGHGFEFNNGEPSFVVFGIEMQFYLRESQRKLTATERLAGIDGDNRFCLNVNKYYPKREFYDSVKPIEEQIARIIATMERDAAVDISDHRERRIRQEIADSERREIQAAEDKKNNELAAFKNLLENVKCFQKAKQIREYILAVEQNAKSSGQPDGKLSEWVQWALAKADWFDPTIEADDELLKDVDRDTLKRKSSREVGH